MRHIDDCMSDALSEIDAAFQQRSQYWGLVHRNSAITARNRNMKVISEMLGTEYRELPLEQPEFAGA